MRMSAEARLYAAAIAMASGIYSVGSAITGDMGMLPIGDSVMLVIGVVVIAHGIVLLTPLAERLGTASGPLMIVWAVIMLANQLVAAMSSSMMVSWDAGMIALAALMLASGVIMSRGTRPM